MFFALCDCCLSGMISHEMCVSVNFEEVEEITEEHKTISEREDFESFIQCKNFRLSLQKGIFFLLLLKKFLSSIEIGILRKSNRKKVSAMGHVTENSHYIFVF